MTEKTVDLIAQEYNVEHNNIYLSVPYSHPTTDVMEARYEAVSRLAWRLMQKNFPVFSPISHSHPLEKINGERENHYFWMNQDLSYLVDGWADLVVVLTAHGWRESDGVQQEIDVAEQMDIPVEHVSPFEVIDVVGASGKKRSGKDTMGDVFADYGFEKYALADPIKRIAQDVFLLSEQQIQGDRKEEEDPYWSKSPREIMQLTGTEGFREAFGGDVWVDALLRRMRLELPEKAVVTDVRFPNEVFGLQDRADAEVVRIDASERLDHDDDHASENALDGFSFENYDRVIHNNGSKAEFIEKCHNIAQTYA